MVKLCSPPVSTRQPSTQGEIWGNAPDKQKHAMLKSRKKAKWEFEKKRLRDYLLVCGLAELKGLASVIVTYRSKNIWLKLLPLPRALFPTQLFQSTSLALCSVGRKKCMWNLWYGGTPKQPLVEWETPAPQKGSPNNPSSLLHNTRPLKEILPQLNLLQLPEEDREETRGYVTVPKTLSFKSRYRKRQINLSEQIGSGNSLKWRTWHFYHWFNIDLGLSNPYFNYCASVSP